VSDRILLLVIAGLLVAWWAHRKFPLLGASDDDQVSTDWLKDQARASRPAEPERRPRMVTFRSASDVYTKVKVG
jgi:hypothetical protein